jgi:hypothetical protein
VTAQSTPGAFLNGQTLEQITAPDKPRKGEFGLSLVPGPDSIPTMVFESVLRMTHLR